MDLASLADLRFVVTPLYWIAAVAYVAVLRSRMTIRASVPTVLLWIAVAGHVLETLGRGALAGQAGGAPFTGVGGFLSLAALAFAGCYLYLESRLAGKALGAFAVPIVTLLHTAATVLYRPPEQVPETLRGPHFVTHVSLTMMAYVGLSIALVSGVTYLILDFMLRRKRPGPLFRKLPNLKLMSRVHHAALIAGVVLLGIGAVAGALWAKSVWGFYFSWGEPKLVITLLGLCAMIICALLWRSRWWRGRRVTWLAVSVIVIMFVAMAVSATLSSELHRFA